MIFFMLLAIYNAAVRISAQELVNCYGNNFCGRAPIARGITQKECCDNVDGCSGSSFQLDSHQECLQCPIGKYALSDLQLK